MAEQGELLNLNTIVSLLTEHNCVHSLLSSENPIAKGFALAITSGVSTYDLRDSSPDGVKRQAMLQALVDVGAVNVGFQTAVLSRANPEPQPEPTPEPAVELDCGNNPLAHTISFTISDTVNPAKQVKVMQRYGTTGDLTEWHELKRCAIRFKQDSYKVGIPQCNHEVRELKLASPVALTVS